jgi:two-component system, chemotaxis family, chemotaxis protein CheY
MENKSVLVVDDSSTFRQLLCMSLARVEGISASNITEAGDGQEALEKIKERKFDLVLTDIRMPRMDGLELVRQVRGEIGKDELPIVIISTKGSEREVELGLSVGANGYLSKPISMAKLREMVTSLLN